MTKSGISKADTDRLISIAIASVQNAYAPYSKFRVGAALLCDGGSIVPGCNVENASYGATVCAERTAIFTAVARGIIKFKALCVASDNDEIILPCGICRQVMFEFGPDITVVCCNKRGDHKIFDGADKLLPNRFVLR